MIKICLFQFPLKGEKDVEKIIIILNMKTTAIWIQIIVILLSNNYKMRYISN